MNFRVFFNEFPLILHVLYGIVWVKKRHTVVVHYYYFFMFVHVTGGESALPLQWAWCSKSNCQWRDLGVQQSKYRVHVLCTKHIHFLWHILPVYTRFIILCLQWLGCFHVTTIIWFHLVYWLNGCFLSFWFFLQSYTQYIPLSVYDLQTWMGSPSIFVYDCNNAGLIVKSFIQFAAQREQEQEVYKHLLNKSRMNCHLTCCDTYSSLWLDIPLSEQHTNTAFLT